MGPQQAGVRVRAVVRTGRQEAAGFVAVPWVAEQLTAFLGGRPFAGTLNLALLDPRSRSAWLARRSRGAPWTVEPGEAGYCAASVYPAVLADGLRCGIVVPHVPEYPADVLEVVSTVHLRTRLGLGDGDEIAVTVLAGSHQ